jgi:hypothetical protein
MINSIHRYLFNPVTKKQREAEERKKSMQLLQANNSECALSYPRAESELLIGRRTLNLFIFSQLLRLMREQIPSPPATTSYWIQMKTTF